MTRVEFFYDDGTSKFIEGNELDRWTGFNHQVALFCQIHRNNPDWTQVHWTEVVPAAEPLAAPESEPISYKSALD